MHKIKKLENSSRSLHTRSLKVYMIKVWSSGSQTSSFIGYPKSKDSHQARETRIVFVAEVCQASMKLRQREYKRQRNTTNLRKYLNYASLKFYHTTYLLLLNLVHLVFVLINSFLACVIDNGWLVHQMGMKTCLEVGQSHKLAKTPTALNDEIRVKSHLVP